MLLSALVRLGRETRWSPSEARRWFERRLEVLRPLTRDAEVFSVLVALASLAVNRDELAELERWMPEMTELAERTGSPVARSVAAKLLGCQRMLEGRFDDAERAFERAADLLVGARSAHRLVELLLLRTGNALQRGRFSEALALIARLGPLGTGAECDNAAALSGLAYVGLGQLARARELHATTESTTPDTWACLRALIAAADGDAEAMARHLADLAAAWTALERTGRTSDAERVAAVAGRWAVERLA